MTIYEYKVVPAPQKGTKARGVKAPEGRFALTIEQVLNRLGADGWEYQRAELLPSEEKSGLTSSTVNWRNVLIFRRAVAEEAAEPAAEPVEMAEEMPEARPGEPAEAAEEPAAEAPDGSPQVTPFRRPVPGFMPLRAPPVVGDPPLTARPDSGGASGSGDDSGDDGDAKP